MVLPTDLRQQLLQHLRDGGVVGSRAFWDGARALLLAQQQVAEEAGDVSGAQGVVEDGAADGLLQDAEQDQLLVDLRRRGGGEGAGLLLLPGGGRRALTWMMGWLMNGFRCGISLQ